METTTEMQTQFEDLKKQLELMTTRFNNLVDHGGLSKKALQRALKALTSTPIGSESISNLTREETELMRLGNHLIHVKAIIAIDEDMRATTQNEQGETTNG